MDGSAPQESTMMILLILTRMILITALQAGTLGSPVKSKNQQDPSTPTLKMKSSTTQSITPTSICPTETFNGTTSSGSRIKDILSLRCLASIPFPPTNKLTSETSSREEQSSKASLTLGATIDGEPPSEEFLKEPTQLVTPTMQETPVFK